jgi:hypothetical protein
MESSSFGFAFALLRGMSDCSGTRDIRSTGRNNVSRGDVCARRKPGWSLALIFLIISAEVLLLVACSHTVFAESRLPRLKGGAKLHGRILDSGSAWQDKDSGLPSPLRLGDGERQYTAKEWKLRYDALLDDMSQAKAQIASTQNVAMQRDALAEKVRTLQMRINVMQAHARGARTGGDDHEERWEDGGNDDSDTEQTLPRLRGGRGSESSLEYSPSIHLRERCSDSTSESSPSRGIETLAFQVEDEAFDGSPPADAHARLRPRTLPIVAKAYSSPRQIDNEDRLISLYVKYMTVQMTHSEAIANESELSSWYAECVRSFQRDDD